MPWIVAGATIGSTLLGIGASRSAAGRANRLQAEAQEKALAALAAGQEKQAEAILRAAQLSVAQLERFFAIAQSYLAPYIKYGENALPDLTEAFESVKEMVSGDFDLQKLANTPGYKFARDEAQGAVERSAAAKGQLLSGRTINAVGDRVAQGVALPAFQGEYDRRRGLAALALSRAQLGSGAAGALASGALSTGQSLAGVFQNQGNQLANIYDPTSEANTLLGVATNQGNLALGDAAARNSLYGNLANSAMNYWQNKQLMDFLKGGRLAPMGGGL